MIAIEFTLFMIPFGVRYLVFERLSWPHIVKHGVLVVIFGADGVLLMRIARDMVGWTGATGLLLLACASLVWVVLVGLKDLPGKGHRHATESGK